MNILSLCLETRKGEEWRDQYKIERGRGPRGTAPPHTWSRGLCWAQPGQEPRKAWSTPRVAPSRAHGFHGNPPVKEAASPRVGWHLPERVLLPLPLNRETRIRGRESRESITSGDPAERGEGAEGHGRIRADPLPVPSPRSQRFRVHGESFPHGRLGHLIRDVDLRGISPVRGDLGISSTRGV